MPIWPWAKWDTRFELVNGVLRQVHEDLARLLARPDPRPPAPPAPFVCVLVEADGPHGPTTLGKSGRAATLPGKALQLTTLVPLTNVRVTVFADLERVNVRGIWRGVDMVNAAIGECPTARFDEWQVGVQLFVNVEAVGT